MEINIDAVKEVVAINNIGLVLGVIRRRKDLTLVQVSNRCKISQGYLSTIFSGKVVPAIAVAEKICEALDVTMVVTFKDHEPQ